MSRFTEFPTAYGEIVSGTIANPGAGSDFVIPVPANRVYLFLSIHFQLTTSAAAAIRNAMLLCWNGLPPRWWRVFSTSAQTANLTHLYTASANWHTGNSTATLAGTGYHVFHLPRTPLIAPNEIVSTIINLQAGDVISNIAYRALAWRL